MRNETLSKPEVARLKRNDSEKDAKRAVQVQIGRIAEKVLDRAEALEDADLSYEYPKNHLGRQFSAPHIEAFTVTSPNDEAFNEPDGALREARVSKYNTSTSVYSIDKKPKRGISFGFGSLKDQKTVGLHKTHGEELETIWVDPSGRQPARHRRRIDARFKIIDNFDRPYNPSSDRMIHFAAPILNQMRNEVNNVDEAHTDSEDEKAA